MTRAGICTRSMHAGGPCNGLPRDDCPTFGETPKEIRDRYAPTDTDVVTCKEARAIVSVSALRPINQAMMLQFIDQAESRQWQLAKALADASVLRAACEQWVRERSALKSLSLRDENARLRAVCEAALESCCLPEAKDLLRAALNSTSGGTT